MIVLADPDYITITKPYRGSVTTQYTVPPQGDEPGIVIVEQPGGSSAPENVVIPATDDRSYVIIIRPHSGPNPISAPITQVVPPRSGQPGQIIIETPETRVGDATPGVLQPLTLEPKELSGYVTVLQPLTGTLASLQLITISPTGTNRGSVIINVPTSALNGGSLQGLTIEPAQDGDYVTVIEPAGTAFRGTVPIRLTVPPSNGNPGTVIIQTPVPGTLRPLALEPLTPNTLGALGLAGQTITLQPADATGYVTIIEPAEGSVTPTAPIRTTIPPTGTKPGTVLIQTPPGWNDGGDGTAFQPTRTRPQGSVSYTTITRGQGGDDDSGPRQTLTIPPEGGNPGTVLVLTPEDPNNPQTVPTDPLPESESSSQSLTGGVEGIPAIRDTVTDVPTGSETSEPDSSSDSADDEASETDSGDPDETGTGASGGATQSGSSGAEPSETDADAESESSDPNATADGSGPGAGPTTDEDGLTITDASGGNPTAIIPADNSLTTDAPDGALATITVFRAGRGPARTTLYVPPQASNDPWTVVIETPVSETQSEAATARGDDDVLATTSAIGGNTNVTIFRAGSSPARRTLYVPPRFANEPGTIVIETPTGTDLPATATAAETGLETAGVRPNITVYSSGTAPSRITIYVPPTASDGDGYIIIETPVSEADTDATESAEDGSGPEASITPVPTDEVPQGGSGNVTLYRAGEGSERSTIFIPPETTGDPWTIVIETPISQTEFVETGTVPGFQTTVSAITGSANLTIFRAGVASTRTTIYVAPKTSGAPGTVIIETPVPRTQTGGLTANPEAQPTLGAGSNTTIFVPVTIFSGGPGSVTRTVYVPPTTSGEAGTLYIETPTGSEATASGEEVISATRTVTVYTGVPGSVTRTVYVPPTAIGEPGTLFIETPVDGTQATVTDDEDAISAATTVTIFSGVPGSVTRSVYVPPTASGEAGTMYIETPTGGAEATASGDEDAISAATTVTIFSGGPASVTRTVYIPPTASGEAGTLIIETPTEEAAPTTTDDGGEDAISAATTVTVFSGGPASVTRTVYIPPTASGEAGTLIIETPTDGPEASPTGNGSAEETEDSTETGAPTEAEEEAISAATTVTIFSGGASGPTAIITPEGPGNVTIYSGGPASSTTTRFIPPTASGEPGTVVIETPTAGPQATGIGNVTIVTGGPATVTQTRYIPATVTDEPGTIVIETPTSQGGPGNTTIYSAVSATGTRTIYIPPTVSGEPGTVIIETPAVRAGSGPANVTVYTGVSATFATTRFVPGTASDEPGTFIVETPIGSPTYVTVYSGGPGTAVTTIYLTPSESGDSTTMIIQTPTQGSGEEYNVEASETIAPSGIRNVTIVSGGPGTATRTIYIPPTASGEAGTVLIETPTGSDDDNSATETSEEAEATTIAPTVSGGNVTIISGGPASVTRTVYIPPTASGEPGTVIIETPTSGEESEAPETGTITEAPGSSATRRVATTITIPGAPGEPDTVLIESPTESGDAEVSESANGPGEVTSTRGGPVTAATTITIPGQSGQPDTVIIETPTVGAPDVTITRGGPVSIATTVTIPGAPGEPDTVLVETPIGSADGSPSVTGSGAGEVTSTRGGPVTAATTITIPGISGQPDTVIIETPTTASDVEVTSTRGGPVTAATTITIPGESGQPDTVIIETPTRSSDTETTETGASPGEVTSTRGGPVTAATTITIPGESGEPDTVIVETPTRSNEPSITGGVQAITSTRGGPVTAATITIPGESGQPDTVIVETPPSSDEVEPSATEGSQDEVTITRGGPVTAATTVTIPGVSGGPDTVFIETPTRSNEPSVTGGLQAITSTRGGPVTAATTITIPGESGQPDTVIVETPRSSDEIVPSATEGQDPVTITRGGPVTAATTVTIPGVSGGPDTVYIETPSEASTGTATAEEVTITRGGPVTAATTVTIPGVSGGPDTVFIETPTQSFDEPEGTAVQEVTITRGGPVTVATTVTIAGVSGGPDTVYIETPTRSPAGTAGVEEVTITRGGPVTAATTVTIPGVSGGPDTVFIETPTQSSDGPTGTGMPEVTITRGGPVTAPITVTVPGVSGGPDTVYIEVPTESVGTGAVQEVTITRGGPVTAATTVTIPGGAGEPDTVYIETPTESADEDSETLVTGAVQEVTITRGGPVTAATTVTIPGVSGGPDTVYIEIPTGSAAGGPVTAATTITIPGASGEPDTVLVEVPIESAEQSSETGSVREVTITRGGPVTAATTLTIPGESGGPDTVLVEIPTGASGDDNEPSITGSVREVTITRGGPVTAATTLTIPGESGGPDTVLIETPTSSSGEGGSTQGEVTITRGGPVTAATTLTIPGASGQPDTVVVETPTESGSESSETDGGQEVTVTRGGPVTAATTITLPGVSGGPDTVIIETPTESAIEPSETDDLQEEVTITQGGPVTVATTITVPGLSGEPDTVIIETPTGAFETPNNALANVTVYSGGPVSVTRTIYFPPGTSGQAGTIVIETPDGSSPTETARGPGNVTVYTGVAGTATRTVFIPATASGEPGTVLIETPTGPLTTSEGRPNTTIFSGGSGSSIRTVYFPPASDDPDGPGTVVIETPTSGSEEEDTEATSSIISTGGPANITRIVGGPASATTTIYIPPTASGEPGVVIIETPTSGPQDETTASEVGRQNVTLYSGGPGTVVTTIYYPPASSDPDEPGTVVIQTPTAGPGEETPSTSASEAATPIQNITRIVGGPASVTTTIYIPPTASGEPGVVIIETPTSGPDDEETSSASITATSSNEEATGIPNVTRYVGGPASITTTIYIPPASSGEPGTVLIQTPSATPDETTTSTPLAESPSDVPNVTRYIDGPASVTTTYIIPPASSGEPGTVVIQTPSASPGESEASASATDIPNVTRYIGGPASVTTTYTIPPASPGEPGTVVIQTPTASPEESATSSSSAEAPTEIPNVTRYVGGPASVTTTYTLPPASSGEPGTVIIQTPSASPAAETTSSREAVTSVESPSAIQNVTRFVGGPASVTTTIYIPPAASGEPGTVLIQTPSSAPEETSSSAAASTTRPPAVAQNTTIFGGGAGSTTRTIYIPPASEGEPGTVLIETPTDSPAASTTPISGAPAGIPTTSTPIVAGTNITIFRAAPPTATAGRTLYDPPTAAGEPGTVIIETMVVSSTSGSAAPLTASSTSSAAPAPVTTSSTSVAAPVVTTSSSAAVPVVATSSSSTTSTSMMPQLAFGPTFDCDGFGYTIQSLLANTLTRVNLVTGQRTDIRTGIGPGGPINGIGFNRLDNYIYGFYQQPLVNAVLCGLLGCKRSGLIRIAKDGRWEVLDLVIGTNAISMGDVDDQGRFWVSEGGGKWWCIDLRPTSNTFGQLLSSGTSATNLLSGVGDWAYVPGGGNYLYAVQASVIENGLLRTNIVRWSLTTQKWERFQSYPNLILTTLNLIWGAVMAAPDGTLFAQETVLGQTWKFTLGSTANPTPIQGGAILNLLGSDGARCAGTLVS
ncbi:hypothetical protein FOC1_g10004980 [Fusarium oxysporum f. sp. cubense race 1]|uniref:Agglutinin-like protein 2 n=1 Tax=Fusarium oxysporum f. sp. cubense (strain race 1) TaxID=1229664 RepID=N4U471_FUSC1|nr:hypothetical protein FOC1_g10004980 [Fusarium oxysporum f. sp. cubense race 1]